VPIQLDASRGSIVVASFNGVVTDAELDAYHESLHASMIAQRGPIVMIVDATHAISGGTAQRARQAAWMKENEHLLALHRAGTAYVVRSALMRTAVQAVLWIQPLPTPHVVVTSLAQAEVWAEEMLRDRTVRRSA
jgi:hypothetical protein